MTVINFALYVSLRDGILEIVSIDFIKVKTQMKQVNVNDTSIFLNVQILYITTVMTIWTFDEIYNNVD